MLFPICPVAKGLTSSAVAANAAADAAAASGAANAADLAARAATLERAAAIASRAKNLSGAVADSPLRAYDLGTSVLRRSMQGAGEAAMTGLENLARQDSRLGEMARNVRATQAARLTREGRLGYNLLRTGWARGQRAYDRVWKIGRAHV